MKWFKHDSDANLDDKLQHLMLDHKLKGYGLYWYCLELIANKFDHTNITFELKHDARIIARNTGESEIEIELMMQKMLDLGLFEQSKGIISCLKLGTRFEASGTSNALTRSAIKQLKDKSQQSHDSVMREEKREEKNREEKQLISDFETFYKAYPKKSSPSNAKKAWLKHKPNLAVVLKSLEQQIVNDDRFREKRYTPHPASWLNGKEWENEVIGKKVNSTYATFKKE